MQLSKCKLLCHDCLSYRHTSLACSSTSTRWSVRDGSISTTCSNRRPLRLLCSLPSCERSRTGYQSWPPLPQTCPAIIQRAAQYLHPQHQWRGSHAFDQLLLKACLFALKHIHTHVGGDLVLVIDSLRFVLLYRVLQLLGLCLVCQAAHDSARTCSLKLVLALQTHTVCVVSDTRSWFLL